jgi:hypothetical protein
MDCRAHDVALGTCALVFENRRPEGDFGKQAREERQPALAAVAAAFGEVGGIGGPERGGPSLPYLPEEGWREDDGRRRFVQFAFERDHFYVYLPRQTLSFDEALEVLWHREGFSYLRDRPQSAMSGEIEGFDPFRRVYLYGDEGQAAEDAAFLFFRVWELPLAPPPLRHVPVARRETRVGAGHALEVSKARKGEVLGYSRGTTYLPTPTLRLHINACNIGTG